MANGQTHQEEKVDMTLHNRALKCVSKVIERILNGDRVFLVFTILTKSSLVSGRSLIN